MNLRQFLKNINQSDSSEFIIENIFVKKIYLNHVILTHLGKDKTITDLSVAFKKDIGKFLDTDVFFHVKKSISSKQTSIYSIEIKKAEEKMPEISNQIPEMETEKIWNFYTPPKILSKLIILFPKSRSTKGKTPEFFVPMHYDESKRKYAPCSGKKCKLCVPDFDGSSAIKPMKARKYYLAYVSNTTQENQFYSDKFVFLELSKDELKILSEAKTNIMTIEWGANNTRTIEALDPGLPSQDVGDRRPTERECIQQVLHYLRYNYNKTAFGK